MKAGGERGEKNREAASAGLALLAGGFKVGAATPHQHSERKAESRGRGFFQVSDAQMRRSSSDYKSIILENLLSRPPTPPSL